MNRLLLILVLLAVSAPSLARDSANEQEKLDAACEAARQEKLAPERARLVDECVREGVRPDRASCERFYADYGNATGGGRAPLYMDLPECVEAFEFRRQRSRG